MNANDATLTGLTTLTEPWPTRTLRRAFDPGHGGLLSGAVPPTGRAIRVPYSVIDLGPPAGEAPAGADRSRRRRGDAAR